ncbi:MAG: electron transfer flavoprotein subunit beta/FixA family protein [Verrucomicrobia bacterium]|nr:electron transfer flavoprotein subunit beta/FixA family protein [Verrucomicrobiota bacterium]
MKILVPIKRVPDTDQKIQVKPDGSGIVTDGLPFVINPFDAIAVEEALRIRERSTDAAEVLAVSVGTEACKAQLRTALAMGADNATLILCDAPLDPWNVACVLKAFAQRYQPDLILMGKQGVDDDHGQTGQMLAALLDWPQATFASKTEFITGGLRVTRETDAGLEIVRVSLPAVVTADLRLNEPRYASMTSIMKARKKTIERITMADLGVNIEPRVEVLGLEAVPSRRKTVRVGSLDELLVKLRDEEKVL